MLIPSEADGHRDEVTYASLLAELASLRASEQRYRQLVSLLPAAVYACEAPSGVITFFNEHAATLWGRTPTLGDTDERFCGACRLYRPDGTHLPADQTPMAVALTEGRSFRNEQVIIEQPGGARITVRVNIDPIRDEKGRVVGAINVFQDTLALEHAEQARAHLAAIVQSSDDAIVSKNLQGVITSWNPAAERLFGYSADEAIGQSITMIIPPGRESEEHDILARIRRGERVDHFETVRRRRDGTTIDVSLTISPIVDSQGRIVGASKIARDITERKVAEEALQEEARIRETLSRVGASLAAELDESKLVQAVTDAGTALTTAEFGAFFRNAIDESGETYPLSALSGAGRDAFAGFPELRATAIFGRTLRGEGPIRIDDVTRDPRFGQDPPDTSRPPGSVPVRSYLAVPVVSRTGHVLGGLFFAHSQPRRFSAIHEQLASGIAAWAAVALDNARLYRDAQEANRAKDEFLATLSHELRTPLNAMLGWSHMLRSGRLPLESRQRALDSLDRNARAQAQLVEDLLDVSRIVSGKLQIRFEEVDLTRVVAEAVDAVRPTATAKGQQLQLEVTPDARILVIGDSDRLRQIVWNLLSNATKFTPRGGRIVVELRCADSRADVIVRDTGEGIPRHFLRHVFERFRQAESSAARQHGGLGLGLAIVRHLVEAHGGTVAADSAGEGHGATFTVTLPGRAVPNQPQASAGGVMSGNVLLDGLRVLVVDDQADARDLLRLLLEFHGADVSAVASAGEALHELIRARFDLLIADIGMPDRDGYSLIQAVRALEPAHGRDIPAIAATAYASAGERQRALAAGYGWHVSKPIDPDQLVSAVLEATNSAGRAEAPPGPGAPTPHL